MSYASSSPSSVTRPAAASGHKALSPFDSETLIFMLALRFAGHLSYFKVASMLLLPQGLSNWGVVVAVAVYSLACLAASRWIAGLRRNAVETPHPAALPLLGATAVFIAMMVMGPVIAILLPRHPEVLVEIDNLLPAWLGMLLPVLTGFFAAQLLMRPRNRKA